jgi:hypothetical protein
LPTEIIDSILEIIKREEDFKTLCSAARVNKAMYDIVVPKIYETVVINEKNKDIVGYGHGIRSTGSESGKYV